MINHRIFRRGMFSESRIALKKMGKFARRRPIMKSREDSIRIDLKGILVCVSVGIWIDSV